MSSADIICQAQLKTTLSWAQQNVCGPYTQVGLYIQVQ